MNSCCLEWCDWALQKLLSSVAARDSQEKVGCANGFIYSFHVHYSQAVFQEIVLPHLIILAYVQWFTLFASFFGCKETFRGIGRASRLISSELLTSDKLPLKLRISPGLANASADELLLDCAIESDGRDLVSIYVLELDCSSSFCAWSSAIH